MKNLTNDLQGIWWQELDCRQDGRFLDRSREALCLDDLEADETAHAIHQTILSELNEQLHAKSGRG